MKKALNACVEAQAVTVVVSDEVMGKVKRQAKIWGAPAEIIIQAAINKWASRLPTEEQVKKAREDEKKRQEELEALIGDWPDDV